MNRLLGIGTVLTATGLAGYLVGLLVSYPGRSVSITGIMMGITLAVIGLWGTPGASER